MHKTSHGAMASFASSPAPADRTATQDDLAMFKLSRPVRWWIDGEERETDLIGMRAFETPDLALLDRHRGRPIAMMQHVVAALCGVLPQDIRDLPLCDFLLLAGDIEWQVKDALAKMGLSPKNYFNPGPAEKRI